jgi:flagellar protein FliS
MWQNAHDAYMESRILSADPLELVHLLYQACAESVREARQHLAAGNIAARCRFISKAHGILAELAASLDHQRGGDLSQRLARLYDYMQRRLLEANLQQDDAPLGEVLELLSTLAEAWEEIRHPAPELPEAASPWSQPLPSEPATAYTAHGWNL